MHCSFTRTCVLMAVAGMPSLVGAQLVVPPAPVAPPAEGAAVSGIYLPDSAAAAERLRMARNLEKAGDWSRAAEAYQELLEQFTDKVIAGEGGGTSGFVSVPQLAIASLCRWPAEAVAVYRGRYEPAAQAMLEGADAGSASSLMAVSRRYFLTSAGTTAALCALDLYWTQGELAQMARCADELLSLHPGIEASRPLLLYQVSIARHLLGDEAAAEKAREELRQRYPQAKGNIGGQDVKLAEDLAARLEERVQRSRPKLLNWPMFGGSPSRAAVPSFAANINARLYSVPLSQGSAAVSGLPPGYPRLVSGVPELMPVVDGGQMFLCDGNRIGALSLDSGGALANWPGVWVTASQSYRAGGLQSLAVTERSVLAVTGGTTAPAWLRAMGQPVEAASLCRIDRQTGAIVRRFSPAILRDKYASLRAVQLTSSLLVSDGRIYVAARGGKNVQIDDSYLLCLDEQTLECRWATYLVSGPSGASYYYDDGSMSMNLPSPQMALDGGRLIVATNLGAVAAVDAATGAIAWIQMYERTRSPAPAANFMWQRRGAAAAAAARPAWAVSPPVLAEGNAFVLPSDADSLLVLDAESGKLRKRLPLGEVDSAACLVGVDGEEMVLAGAQAAWCVNWRLLGAEGRNLADATNWNMRFAPGSLKGRPFLTAESLYLATDKRLLRIGRGKWKVDEAYPPASRAWPAGEGPGNLLVTADHVAVVGGGRVNVYASLSAAESQLEAQAKANPSSPDPVLRLAELSLAGGDYALALKRLGRAAPLVDSRPGASDRLHLAAEATWRELAGKKQEAPAGVAEGFLELAKKTARTPQQRASLWWRVGQWATEQRQHAVALDAYDHLLADEAARQVSIVAAGRGMQPAWLQCHVAIGQLIKAGGPGLYNARASLAAQRFKEARAAGDSAALVRAAMQFSNAAGAPGVMLDAARSLRKGGQLAGAAEVLRDAQRLYGDDAALPAILEESARVYCLMPRRLPAAAGRLRLGAEMLGNPQLRETLELPAGRIAAGTTFAAAAGEIEMASQAAKLAELPDFRLAVGTGNAFGPEVVTPGIRSFLEIEPHAQRDDYLVLVTSQGELCVRRPGEAEARFSGKVGLAEPEAGCWLDETLFVWSRDAMMAVAAGEGKARWRLAMSALPPLPEAVVLDEGIPSLKAQRGAGVVAAREDLPVINAPGQGVGEAADDEESRPGGAEYVVSGDAAGPQVVVATSRGRVAAMEAASGRVKWQVYLPGCTAQALFTSDDYTVIQFGEASPLQLAALDNSTGQMVYRIARMPGMQLLNFDMTPGGRLVFTLPGRLCARDLFDTGDGLAFDVAVAPADLFGGMVLPSQLAVLSDRIVAVTRGGTQLRAFSLQTGKPMPIPQAGAAAAESVPTLGSDAATRLVLSEPFLYACSKGSLAAYNVQLPQQPQRRLPKDARDIRSIALGRQHLVLFDAPVAAGPAVPMRFRGPLAPAPAPAPGPAKVMRVLAYSRAQTVSGEVGRLDVMHELKDAAGIVDCNAVQGGVAYISGGNVLHFLPGAARSGGATSQPAVGPAAHPAGGAP